MRVRLAGLLLAVVFGASSCLGGGGGEKTVLVDGSSDRYASFFIADFPRFVDVTPGQSIVFKQTWTGEAHTVTGGRITDKLDKLIRPLLKKESEGKPTPDEPPAPLAKLENDLPFVYGPTGDAVAAPCYLRTGTMPANGKLCETRKQPEFDGRYTVYSSGIIPYQGLGGNTYKIRFANDAKPGRYFFYCAVHGTGQGVEVTIKPKGSKVASAAETIKEAQAQLSRHNRLNDKAWDEARRTGKLMLKDPFSPATYTMPGPFAGLGAPLSPGTINEFLPRTMHVKVNQKIAWSEYGGHTISFGVPKYVPIVVFRKNGKVERNPILDPPAGGAKAFNPDDKRYANAQGPISFDAGTYDGKGFWSSGLLFSPGSQPFMRYSMRISKPGTYKYACLVHPPMVGTIVVTR